MRVAILGGTRFVGEAIARRFLAQGASVTLFNRGRTPDGFGSTVARRSVDRSLPGALASALVPGERFDSVVDATAYERRDSEEAARAFEGRCARFIHVSTGQVYLIRRDYRAPARESEVGGALLTRPDDPDDLREWLYGVGKWACEEALAGSRLPAIRLRIPVVLGPRDHSGRLCWYVRHVRAGTPIRARDGGRNVLRHIDVEDVARAVAALAGAPGASLVGRALNVAQEEMPTHRDLVGLVAEIEGRQAPEIIEAEDGPANGEETPDEKREGRAPFGGRWSSVLDIDEARRAIDWRPTPWRQTIADAVVGCS